MSLRALVSRTRLVVRLQQDVCGWLKLDGVRNRHLRRAGTPLILIMKLAVVRRLDVRGEGLDGVILLEDFQLVALEGVEGVLEEANVISMMGTRYNVGMRQLRVRLAVGLRNLILGAKLTGAPIAGLTLVLRGMDVMLRMVVTGMVITAIVLM